ncbi:MAG TPA: D-amino acid aminotransferase [Gemmataceae bacterium]|nr:D-amino acid aminotransferase [Gemmataceae bacterium]
MKTLANLNGEIMPLAEVKISALDRGFLFGDAVYEVLRVYQGKPWLQREHFERLQRSLKAIRMPGIDLQELRKRVLETIAAGGFAEATVYIQITRGAYLRSHAFPAEATPLEFLYVQELQDVYRESRLSGVAVITHPDIRWARCDIKSTNLLGNVLAMQAAKEAGCLEALLYSPDGTVTEGTHTSLFGVKGDMVLTAPNSNAVLPGITRALVLRLAKSAGIPVREQILKKDDLGGVAELFLTGTTAEVLPVVQVDGRPVGDGCPGPFTRRLQQAYAEAVAAFVLGSVEPA